MFTLFPKTQILKSVQPLKHKTFTSQTHLKMPLVVPGITSSGGEQSKTDEWTNKLVGKKIGESSDSTVSFPVSYRSVKGVKGPG